MIETEASVLSVERGHAWVAPKPHSPCGQCDPVYGCRSLQLARMFALREPRFRVLDPLGVQPGDKVLIAVPEKKPAAQCHVVVPAAGAGPDAGRRPGFPLG